MLVTTARHLALLPATTIAKRPATPPPDCSERTRSELSAFLLACRERLSPADLCLASGGRRRTPGLRREEVAALAGVGLTWYTCIHQLVDELERVSPEFKLLWRKHDVHAPCTGVRTFIVDGVAHAFEHTTLTIDEDRHLRLVVYAQQQDSDLA